MSDRIEVKPISGFPEWLPGVRLQEERFLTTIRQQYQLFGFTPIETPAVMISSRASEIGTGSTSGLLLGLPVGSTGTGAAATHPQREATGRRKAVFRIRALSHASGHPGKAVQSVVRPGCAR